MSAKDVFRIAVRRFEPFEIAIRTQWEKFVHDTALELELETVAFDLPDLYDTLFVQEGLALGVWDVAFLSTDWIAAAAEQMCLTDLAGKLRDGPPEGYPDAWM